MSKVKLSEVNCLCRHASELPEQSPGEPSEPRSSERECESNCGRPRVVRGLPASTHRRGAQERLRRQRRSQPRHSDLPRANISISCGVFSFWTRALRVCSCQPAKRGSLLRALCIDTSSLTMARASRARNLTSSRSTHCSTSTNASPKRKYIHSLFWWYTCTIMSMYMYVYRTVNPGASL